MRSLHSDTLCWCGESDWNTVLRDGEYRLLRCVACGGYRNHPTPLAADEAAADFYTRYYQSVGAGTRRAADLRIEKSQYWRVVRCCPELKRVAGAAADIGCGDGHLCARLQAWGWGRVVGFEVSHSRAARARALYPNLEIYDCPPAESGIAPATFDLAVMEAVIEHLPQPVEALAAIRPLLKPAGSLVLTTPNLDSGQFRLAGRRWKQMLCPHAHIYLFTAASLATLLDRAGYDVTATGSYHDPLCSPLEYLRRLARGDVRSAAWKALQEAGALYGRLLRQGPTLFAVARPRPA